MVIVSYLFGQILLLQASHKFGLMYQSRKSSMSQQWLHNAHGNSGLVAATGLVVADACVVGLDIVDINNGVESADVNG